MALVAFSASLFPTLQLDILEDHFLNNILRMKRHEVWKELQKLSRPVDKKR